MIPNKYRALRLILKGCTAAASPGCVTEISTESSVEDDSVVGKVSIDIAARTVENRVRKFPTGWVWIPRADI